MHVPHYHKKRSWQIFLLGVFAGSIIAYLVFSLMYSKMYEQILTQNVQLRTQVTELEHQNEALLQDQEDREEQKTGHTVQKIEIEFSNHNELRLDRLIIHELEDLLKNEINYIIGKDIESLTENDDLLITVIENKTFTIDDLSYQFEVKKLFISEQVKVTLHIKLAD